MPVDGPELVVVFIRVAIATAASLYIIRKLFDYVDPTNAQKKKAKAIAEALLKRVGVKDKNIGELSEYELLIATHVVQTDVSGVEWGDIGGYQKEIADLQDSVILPLKLKSASALFSPPHGVLLYGPPGCGKTLLARAVAKAAGARFINLQVSTLTDKWYGESNKLAAAVFSLAAKLQPSIIFLDEIDSFLRSRNSYDHEATAQMKALFMSLWDGFNSMPSCRIIIMGATNRPQDVDPAILRRMPCRFCINMPLDAEIDIDQLARLTDGFSGSDLREVSRLAAINRAKELVLTAEPIDDDDSRLLNQEDFTGAIQKYKKCKNLDSFLLTTPMQADSALD